MCDVLLPPGVNPTAVKYIYIYIISYHIISYIISQLSKCLIVIGLETDVRRSDLTAGVWMSVITKKAAVAPVDVKRVRPGFKAWSSTQRTRGSLPPRQVNMFIMRH
jgi:hypothetical protein